MSEEIIETKIENTSPEQPSLVPGFKSICVRIGIMMIVVFASRAAVSVMSVFLAPYFAGMNLTPMMAYLIDAVISVVFLYIVPITAAIFLLKRPIKGRLGEIYAKPKYFGRALAMFPAGYGVAITCNLLTQLLGLLFRDTALSDSFTGIQNVLAAPDMSSAVVLFVQLTILAPIFEEFWCRGLIIESLRPYGNGFAIFVSAVLFGMLHANFAQFFYATALGIFLGYIYVSTGSLITTTIMHAMFNSISGVMILLMSEPSVSEYIAAAASGEEPVATPAAVMYIVWMALIVLLLAVGIIMAIFKFVKIKKYRVPKMQTEMSTGKRWGIFLSRISVIVMLLLAVDTFATQEVPKFFVKLFTWSW